MVVDNKENILRLIRKFWFNYVAVLSAEDDNLSDDVDGVDDVKVLMIRMVVMIMIMKMVWVL